MNSGIYLITNNVSGKEYIGSSKNLSHRRHTHWFQLKKGEHDNPHLQRAWNSYGKESFQFVVLEYCEFDYLLKREQWWMDLLDTTNYNKGYNLQPPNRQKVADSTRAKISAYHKGKPKSPEHRAKMSAAAKGKLGTMLGRTFSPEHRAKIGAKSRGRRHTEETKAKMSASKKALFTVQSQDMGCDVFP